MTTQAESAQHNHRRAVRFFWAFLIGASTISLIGNVAHAVLPYISHVAIQIGAAAVPPIALLAAVHGIALGVRAGTSGRIYAWAVVAVSAIGVGAFTVSFLALRDLMHSIGYSAATAWVFPAIIDTTVAVSTMMLVALGDKPVRRTFAAAPAPRARLRGPELKASPTVASGKLMVNVAGLLEERIGASAAHVDEGASDTDLALKLIASRITTQPPATVTAVLAAHRDGASINAAAKSAGVNYRTAQRIIGGANSLRRTCVDAG